jgi:hypothetical protein
MWKPPSGTEELGANISIKDAFEASTPVPGRAINKKEMIHKD